MNSLTHLEEFQTILSNYQASEVTVAQLKNTRLALLVGATSSGKNTIINELLKTNKFKQLVSDTTRKPRVIEGVSEKNGVNYYFRSEEEILAGLQAGEYVEAALIHEQQVSGMRVSELSKLETEQKTGLTEVDVNGAELYKSLDNSIKVFFVIPPSFTVWMQRMTGRGEMDPEEVKRRLKTAEAELQNALDTDHYTYIINDKLQVAVTEILSVLSGRAIDQEEHKETAWKLLNELKANTSS